MTKFDEILFDFKTINQLNEEDNSPISIESIPAPTWDDNQMNNFIATALGSQENGPNYLNALSILMNDSTIESTLNVNNITNIYNSLNNTISNLLNTSTLSGLPLKVEEVDDTTLSPSNTNNTESETPIDVIAPIKSELSVMIPQIKSIFSKIKDMTSDEYLQTSLFNLHKLYKEQPDAFNALYEQTKTGNWREQLTSLINNFSQQDTVKKEQFDNFTNSLNKYLVEKGLWKLALGLGDDAIKWGKTFFKGKSAAAAAKAAAMAKAAKAAGPATAKAATVVGKLTWPKIGMLFAYPFIDKSVDILTMLASKGFMMPLTILRSCLDILRKYKGLILRIFLPVQIISGVIINSGNKPGEFTGPMMQEMLDKIVDFGFEVVSEMFKIIGLKELTSSVTGLGHELTRNLKTGTSRALGVTQH